MHPTPRYLARQIDEAKHEFELSALRFEHQLAGVARALKALGEEPRRPSAMDVQQRLALYSQLRTALAQCQDLLGELELKEAGGASPGDPEADADAGEGGTLHELDLTRRAG